jgi:hypothetical protein
MLGAGKSKKPTAPMESPSKAARLEDDSQQAQLQPSGPYGNYINTQGFNAHAQFESAACSSIEPSQFSFEAPAFVPPGQDDHIFSSEDEVDEVLVEAQTDPGMAHMCKYIGQTLGKQQKDVVKPLYNKWTNNTKASCSKWVKCK